MDKKPHKWSHNIKYAQTQEMDRSTFQIYMLDLKCHLRFIPYALSATATDKTTMIRVILFRRKVH